MEHATINWSIKPLDFARLVQVARRVERDLKHYPDDRHTLIMDLNACHSNGCPLDFEGLLAASELDFSHDIYGIREHINRRTGQVLGFFTPRYAAANREGAQ